MRYHFTTPHKPEESRKVLEFTSKHDTSAIRQWQEPGQAEEVLLETPELQAPKRRLMWLMQKKSGLNSYSFTLRRSGFQKPSSASLSSLLYPQDHWTEIPAGLHAVAVLMGHVRYRHRTSPCTCQRKQGKHHRGTTHRTLAHSMVEGMHTRKSSPIGPISKEPYQTAAISLRMLNGEWCETPIPPKKLSSIICCKHFLSTKAVHGAACNTSTVGLQVLRSRLAHRDFSKATSLFCTTQSPFRTI